MKQLKKVLNNPKLVLDFLEGTVRYWLYIYAPYLIRAHIIEQYHWRLFKADKCLRNKSCLSCGCNTPELFFCTKACSLNEIDDISFRELLVGRKDACYGKLLNKKEWSQFKQNNK